ncbi:flagellar hook-associated protein FlgK [Selenomonas bovis]|uniref:flagellar hook-associated protein FlgK n=1 Tax=Selenomonas bovis TaxID=416586 RepID=UPI0004E20C98|nr:flagellar hook-associated protein FlgK [Selenomonas bovis]
MRSTFAGLNTMVRGIYSNQLSLDTTGHNITNASTEGYSRQSVNLAATRGQQVSSIYGQVMVGTGVDSTSIERARNVYADKQYWSETAQQQYYKTQQTNYDKVEAIFNDSGNTGVKNALTEFYNAWNDLSTSASTASNRTAVIEKGNVLADRIKTASQQLQAQINAQYDDMRLSVTQINDYTDQLVKLNQNIMTTEATGASANDLRDQRDLIVDNLSKYMNLNVYEDEKGMYSVVSNGITMVNGINKLTLEMSEPQTNEKYGINDYTINIKESGIAYLPTNGSLKAQMDTIAEDKGYLDDMSNIAGFMLTTFNTMHQQGAGIDGTDSSLTEYYTDGNGKKYTDPAMTTEYTGPSYGENFWGDNNTLYTWDAENSCIKATKVEKLKHEKDFTETKNADGTVTRTPKVTLSGTGTSSTLDGINIINALTVNTAISSTGGQNIIAARKLTVEQTTDDNGKLGAYEVALNGSGDGTNATNLSTLINMDQDNVTSTANVVYSDGTASFMDTTTAADKITATLKNNMVSRSLDKDSVNAYYSAMVAQLGSDSESLDDKADAQDDLILQITNWRSSTSGVDWNEELSNMIMFQKGYSACSRCLTTMDEMLDKLINSTGMVGR